MIHLLGRGGRTPLREDVGNMRTDEKESWMLRCERLGIVMRIVATMTLLVPIGVFLSGATYINEKSPPSQAKGKVHVGNRLIERRGFFVNSQILRCSFPGRSFRRSRQISPKL